MSGEREQNWRLTGASVGVLVTPFLSCILGFAGTVALITRSQEAIGASPMQAISAITSLCIAISIVGFVLTLWLRVPIILGWSTPGAALLAAYPAGGRYSDAIGAFLIAGGATLLVGCSSTLRRMASGIPTSISSAMLAGIVFPFCVPLFHDFPINPILIFATLGTFIIVRRIKAIYAIPASVAVAVMVNNVIKPLNFSHFDRIWGILKLSHPAISLPGSVELALPLFVVTFVSQNLPGMLVVKSAGYTVNERIAVTSLGLASIVIAPFGGHGVGLASLTAAMCIGDESGLAREKRWMSGIVYAVFYAIVATFCAPIIYFFASMPHELLVTITAVAVIPILISSMANMMAVVEDREAVVLTFIATASGMFFAGIGSAFWGLLVGGTVLIIKRGLWLGTREKN
ncbi:benzoate/H(+) symporter BenE family transporter [Burkholderia ambifaria]|uniref:benzoate/H(+) symporter BenE family transporter n=1 Tax=Burkholderia ambifaria TaxID=152480 RepID=UPI002FE3CDC5